MTAPLVDSLALSEATSLAVAVGIGVAFGWTLERAGLGNARKLAGQFYLSDLTVFKVMFSAVITAMLGAFWLARLGVLDLERVYVPETWIVARATALSIFCTAAVAAVPGRRRTALRGRVAGAGERVGGAPGRPRVVRLPDRARRRRRDTAAAAGADRRPAGGPDGSPHLGAR